MVDTHCHLDLYPNPSEVAAGAEKAGVTTICVTNSPAAFEAAYESAAQFRRVRLALGLHPLVAAECRPQWPRFAQLIGNSAYIGEVGLDFSRAGVPTRNEQVAAFRFVLDALNGRPKFITVHSLGAESAVVELLEEHDRCPVVFHWYSGPTGVLKRAIANGHYFSVNPAMGASNNGRKILSIIPRDRLLTETDGPFVKVGGRIVVPEDVQKVVAGLSTLWNLATVEVESIIEANFQKLSAEVGI